jgi:hypothetical protein
MRVTSFLAAEGASAWYATKPIFEKQKIDEKTQRAIR